MSIAVVVVVSLLSMTQAAVAVTALLEPDVAAFSSRAEQWTEARQTYRDAANVQALELAADGRQAEADRLAAEEAARVIEAARVAENERLHAAEDAARVTTTTVPPTTAPPTTAPPTTLPPTTVVPSTVPPTIASDPPPTTTPPTSTEPASPAGPSATQWEVLRQCESSGNYTIVSSNGRYRGAYQFSQATWNWVAGFAFPALGGVDPAAASPSDQDAMALALWDRQGWSPWPICGARAAAS